VRTIILREVIIKIKRKKTSMEEANYLIIGKNVIPIMLRKKMKMRKAYSNCGKVVQMNGQNLRVN